MNERRNDLEQPTMLSRRALLGLGATGMAALLGSGCRGDSDSNLPTPPTAPATEAVPVMEEPIREENKGLPIIGPQEPIRSSEIAPPTP
jgi:hypothetical protein